MHRSPHPISVGPPVMGLLWLLAMARLEPQVAAKLMEAAVSTPREICNLRHLPSCSPSPKSPLLSCHISVSGLLNPALSFDRQAN